MSVPARRHSLSWRLGLFLVITGTVLITVLMLVANLRMLSDPALAIPEDAVAFLEWENPAQSLQRLHDSTAGAYLLNADFSEILGQFGRSSALEQFETARRLFLDFSDHPLLQRILSGKTVCALLPGTSYSAGLESSNLVMVSAPSRGYFSSFLLLGLIQSYQGQWSGKHQGVSLYRVRLDSELSFLVAWCRGVAIAGFSEHAINKCIDLVLLQYLSSRPVHVLADNPHYRYLKNRTAGRDDVLFAIDGLQLQKVLRRAHLSALVEHYPMAAVYHQRGEGTDLFTVVARGGHRYEAAAGKSGVSPSRPVPSPSSLPAELLLYFWSNWFSLEHLWQAAAASDNRIIATTAFLVALRAEEYTGMALEELFSLFTSDSGLIVDRLMTNGFFPVPRLCIALGIRDPQAVSRVLQRVLHRLPVTSEKVGDTPVHSLQIARGLMHPSYALVDKTLLLADNREQIELLLSGSGPTLVEDADYRKVDMGFAQPANLLAFVRTEAVNDGLKELAQWVVSFITATQGGDASKGKVLLEKIVLPLLDSVNQYKAKGVRGYRQENDLVLDIVLAS